MAGPGTGKSFAMKRRIARLIEVDKVDPGRILAVTFTRTAAADLKRELHKMDIPGAEKIRAGTVHGLCFHLLLSNEVFDFLGREPRGLLSFSKSKIYRFEAEPLIEDISALGNFGTKREITKRIRAFEADWARLQHEKPGWPVDSIDQAFHAALTDWLCFHRGILIGELVPEALRYLRNNPASPAFEAYDHVIVDEYQDLNRAEQELIDLLSAGRSLCIVGDVDQSIYRFRYAHPEGIYDFSKRHHAVEDQTLGECRRCGAAIVTVADNVILKNYPPATPHRLLPIQQAVTASVRMVQWRTLKDEAKRLSGFIQHIVTKRGVSPGDILVLSPRRLIANEIKTHLAAPEIGIPAHSFYNDKLLEPVEAQLAMTKLQLLSDPEDRIALRFWLGSVSPSWLSGQYSSLRAYCGQNGETPSRVLDAVISGQLKMDGINKLTDRYRDLRSEVARLGKLNPQAVFDDLFPGGTEWADPIRELLTGKLNDIQDTKGLLDLLRNEITQPEMPSEGDFVRLMSLHKSKGLTSRVTIIVGCIRGLIPFVDEEIPNSEVLAHIQEQRRLFYVALTRAKETLVLSSTTNIPRQLAHKIGAIMQGGNSQIGKTIACEFLQELGTQAFPAHLGNTWAAGGYQ
jgi:superfamily I DNA/RNA helicase